MAKSRSSKKERREQKRRKKASKKQTRSTPLDEAKAMSDPLTDAVKLRTLVKRKMDHGTWDPATDAVEGLDDPEQVLKWIDTKLKGASLNEVSKWLNAGLFVPDDVIQDVALKTDEPDKTVELLLKLRDTKAELHDLDALIGKLQGDEDSATRKFADSEEQVRAALEYIIAKLNRGESLDEKEQNLIRMADEHNLLTESFHDTNITWTLQGEDLMLTGDNLHHAMQVPRNRDVLASQIAAKSSTLTFEDALAKVEKAFESMMAKGETVVAQSIDESTPPSATAHMGETDLAKARAGGDELKKIVNWPEMLKQLTIRHRRLHAEQVAEASPAMAMSFGLNEMPKEKLDDEMVASVISEWDLMRANCPPEYIDEFNDVIGKLKDMGDGQGKTKMPKFLDERAKIPPAPYGTLDGKVSKNQDDATVSNYMGIMGYLFDVSRGKIRSGHPSHKRDASLAWAMMRDARIIHFDPQTWADLDNEADSMVVEKFMGMSADKFWNEIEMTEDLATKHYNAVAFGAKRAPWPEHFPFDAIWIGYGEGVWLEQKGLAMRFNMRRWGLPEGVISGAVVGHLVTATGHVWEFTKFRYDDGSMGMTYEHIRHVDGGWVRRYDLAPWTVPALVEIVNQHRTMVIEQDMPDFRSEMRDRRKQLGLKGKKYRGHVPPPFYVVKVRNRTIIERLRHEDETGTGRSPSYRHDVRGHWRCRIRAGKLPLDPKTKENLTKREYKVYEHMQPKGEDLERIMERGRRKGPDEWIAIKSTFIEAHQSPNNPELPYVPATRRVDLGTKTPVGFVEEPPKDEPASGVTG